MMKLQTSKHSQGKPPVGVDGYEPQDFEKCSPESDLINLALKGELPDYVTQEIISVQLKQEN